MSSDKLDAAEKKYIEMWCNVFDYETLATTSDAIFKGLEKLSNYLIKHFSKNVFVLVDEYDSVCSGSIVYIKDQKKIEKVIAL